MAKRETVRSAAPMVADELTKVTPIYLSIADSAAHVGLSRMTIYRMMGDGLPSYTVGTRRLIKRVELEKWIEGGGRPAAEVAA